MMNFTNHKSIVFIAASAFMLAAGVIDARASYPEGYYDSLNGKCGAELMAAIKNVVKNHKEISYGADTWKAFEVTDVRTVDGVDYWWDMYSDNLVPVSAGRPNSTVMNIEHSVANSWWGGTKNAAYKDIVHLNPSDATANNRKANYPLSEVGSVNWTNGVTIVGSPKSGQGGGASYCYEPCDEYKGDFARVFMYMFTVYDDISWASKTDWMYNTSSDLMFKPWAQTLLLRWHQNDPVSQKERTRNDGVYIKQNNRNPFIDLPDLADHIWGVKKSEPYSVDGNDTPGPGDDDPQDETKFYEWLSSEATDMGDWTTENISMSSGMSYIWSWKETNGNHYLNASSYISGTPREAEGYAWSPELSFEGVKKATFSFSHAARYQTTLRDLCGVVVKDVDTDEISQVRIPVWPGAGSWTFTESGNIDLSDFAGKHVRIGFHYKGETSGADTWEINDAKLMLVKESTEVELAPDYGEDSFLVEVWGNNILAPEGARIFDINGREFDGKNLGGGLYIVVKPTFEKAVKVLIK